MNKIYYLVYGFIFFILSHTGHAAPNKTQLAVWANEAIIATYTFNYQTFIQDQKNNASYFSADGWIAYTKALNASGLPETIQKNAYAVTAVATQPPALTNIDATHWQAIMPILVVYTNPQYQQQQNLKVVINFSTAPKGQGVRGLNITSLQSTITTAPCQCPKEKASSTPKNETQ